MLHYAFKHITLIIVFLTLASTSIFCQTAPAQRDQSPAQQPQPTPAPGIQTPSAQSDQSPQNQRDLALVGAKIYPSPTAQAIEDGTVIIRNGKITAIGGSRHTPVPKDIRVIDCKGMVLTAAFWNCHVHFIEQKWQHADSTPAAQLTAQMQDMTTSRGFAHVFELATFDLRNLLHLRDRIRKGEVDGPCIFTAGVPFTPPNGSPFYIAPLKLPEIGDPLEAAAYVNKQIDSGADALKIWSASPAHRTVIYMPLDVAKAGVKAAHDRGKPVFAHPTNNKGVEIAIESGVDILAHTAPDDKVAWSDTTISKMLAGNMALIPTLKLFIWEPERAGISRANNTYIPTALKQLSQYSKAGGQILFGTDLGYVTDYSTEEEFSLMAEAGLSFPQILASLTTAPAKRFGLSAITGKIAIGMDADIVLLASDPATDITSLSKVNYTIYQGKVIYSRTKQ